MKKLLGLLVISAAILCAQNPIQVGAYIINGQNTPIFGSLAFTPSIMVMILDPTRADGYVVSVTGTDTKGAAFSFSFPVQASGTLITNAGVPVDAASFTVKVVPYRLDQTRAVTVP